MSTKTKRSETATELRVDYYPQRYMDGVRFLAPKTELVYWRLCNLIYINGGSIPDEDQALRHETRAGGAWKRIKAALIAEGKIFVADGRITNERCEIELGKVERRSSSASQAGRARHQGNLKLVIQGGKSGSDGSATAGENPPENSATAEKQGGKNPATDPAVAAVSPPLSRARVDDDSSLPSGRDSENPPPPPQTPPPPPVVGVVVQAFFESRREAYPEASAIGIDEHLIAAQAAEMVGYGLAADRVAGIVRRVMRERGAAGEAPPSVLRFCWKSVKAAAAQERRDRHGDGAGTGSGESAGAAPVDPEKAARSAAVARWFSHVKLFVENGIWPDYLGPKPGTDGCKAPDWLITEVNAKFGAAA
jgi:uncharacterized protein YdaU (DUF1376 family)